MKDKKQNPMLNSDFVIGAAGILFGLWWLYMSMGLPSIEVRDGTPSPGVFPIGLSVLLMVISALLMISSIRSKKSGFSFGSITKENRIKIGLSLLLFVGFMAVWSYVHYIPASFLLCMGLSLIYKMKPVSGACLSLAFSVGTYFVFTKMLLVMLDVAH